MPSSLCDFVKCGIPKNDKAVRLFIDIENQVGLLSMVYSTTHISPTIWSIHGHNKKNILIKLHSFSFKIPRFEIYVIIYSTVI